MPRPIALEDLRRYAVARSLFTPTSLPAAIHKLGFVQADPIRAPARAQDLILRHRVKGYQNGDLERRYARLPIEEDFFINYGFLPRATQALMHPRSARQTWTAAQKSRAAQVLAYVRSRGVVHPREVDAHFQHGKERNWFGGSSNASTQLLDGMHYRGLLRVARREGGIRLYAAREASAHSHTEQQAMDALVDVIVRQYAPLPAKSLGYLLSLLCRGVPQWAHARAAALTRAKARLAHTQIDNTRWYWPLDENPLSPRFAPAPQVRLLAPFDPIVWDRTRFEFFWRWPYRFEAYTPAPKRQLGYYAMPLLWGDDVLGWANVSNQGQHLEAQMGLQPGVKRLNTTAKRELQEELARFCGFMGLDEGAFRLSLGG